MTLHFQVPGKPQGKGRARFGNGRTYTPAKTVAYESLIAMAGEEAMAGDPPIDRAVDVHVIATFPIPKSWSTKKKSTALWHTGKPDGDNILKAVGDGLNGIVWTDDSNVACVRISKMYGEKPGLDIMVGTL